MAEEKKTKKATKDAEVVKEIKVEKKFCTNCGKELSEGEICDCKKVSPSTNVDTDELVKAGKEFVDTTINMYKKPESTIDAEVSKNTLKKTLIVLGVLAVSYGLYLMGFFKALLGLVMQLFVFFAEISGESVGAMSSINFAKYIDLPYFKIFIYGLLLYYLLAFLPVLASLAVAKINKNNEFSFHKATNLYVISMLPTVFSNVVLAVVFMLNVSFLTKVGLIIGVIINLICLVNYILGFLKEADVKKDRKAYSVTGLIVIWLVLSYVVTRLIVAPVLTDIFKDFRIGNNNSGNIFDLNTNDDLFNW